MFHSAVVAVLEPRRRDFADLVVDAAIVEPVDVVERGPFDVLCVAPGTPAVDQLGVVGLVEVLGEAS
jgi:hypothetical protein